MENKDPPILELKNVVPSIEDKGDHVSYSKDGKQFVPLDSPKNPFNHPEKKKEHAIKLKYKVNFKKFIEDPYTYNGFNNAWLSLIFMIIAYQTYLSIHFEYAGDKAKLNLQFIPPEAVLEDNSLFIDWAVEKVSPCIHNKRCLGASIEPVRISFAISPILCKNENYWPRGSNIDKSSRGIHPNSKMKAYEMDTCKNLESWDKDKSKVIGLLKNSYGLYSYSGGDECSSCLYTSDVGRFVTVPLFSAELSPQNSSIVFNKQLNSFLTAMKNEEHLLLDNVIVESMNAFDHGLYLTEAYIDPRGKKVKLWSVFLDTVDLGEKTAFICWSVLFFIATCFFIWEEWNDMQATREYTERENKYKFSILGNKKKIRTGTCQLLRHHLSSNVYNFLDAATLICGVIFFIILILRLVSVQ